MANVIKHKRGSGSDPAANNLVIGELAIRTDNGKLFTKMDSGAIAEIAGGGSDIAINTLSSSSATGGGSATFNGSAYRFTLSSPPSVSAAQLLVSVNGVIQKPVPGTGQPSEGFSVDGNDIIFGDAPATGADFFILTFRSLGVSEPADNSVTSAKIVDGAIVNADINASAAIAGSKISPNFGGQNIQTTGQLQISGALPTILLNDENNENDFEIRNENGNFKIRDIDNPQDRYVIASSGMIHTFHGAASFSSNLDVGAGLDVTGNITGTGDLFLTADTPKIRLIDSNADDDFQISNFSGNFIIKDITNSVDRFTIESDGTTSVANNLNIGAGIDVTGDITATGNINLLDNGTIFGGDDAANTLILRSASGNVNHSRIDVGVNEASDNGGLHFYTAGSTHATRRMTIKGTSGNVGIGNTSPQQLLHVWPDTANTTSAYVRVTAGDRNSNTGVQLGHNSSGNAELNMVSNGHLTLFTNNAERLTILNTGNVGIGTTTPEGSGLDIATSRTTHYSDNADQRGLANLVLRQTSDAANRFVGLSFVNGGSFQAEASINLMQTGNYNGDLRFKFRTGGGSTDWRSRFRMTAAGMMGFNGNPNRYLHVNGRTDGGNFGTAAFEQNNVNNSAAVMFMSTLRNGNSGESFLQCNRDQDNNGQGVRAVFFIRTNGDCDSDTNSYGGISDIKLKENIVDAKSQWNDIKNIRVRNFNFKDNPGQKMLGVVAQEVETVSAGLVKDCPDENITSPGPEGTSTKSVKYSILYMKAIKALQEAQIRIETLESKVTALEAK